MQCFYRLAEGYRVFSLPGQFAPWSESANRTLADSLLGQIAPWRFRLPDIWSSKQLFLLKPPVRTEIARRAFSQAAPTAWNDLPLDSRSAETYERFRSATKKHFYELAFTNWSCECFRSHDSFFLRTDGASPNLYSNNNNFPSNCFGLLHVQCMTVSLCNAHNGSLSDVVHVVCVALMCTMCARDGLRSYPPAT